MRARILLFDGFDELDALGPFEVLANGLRASGAGDVALVTLQGARPVPGAHGCVVHSHAALGADLTHLIVPGGGWNDRRPAGARAEAERGEVPAAIAAAHRGGAVIAAVCTGGMLVAGAGLLAGRPATTHHAALEELGRSGADVVRARVVDDGDVLTCGGVTSGLDLALWLLERDVGPEYAALVAREIEHERVGEVWRRPAPAA